MKRVARYNGIARARFLLSGNGTSNVGRFQNCHILNGNKHITRTAMFTNGMHFTQVNTLIVLLVARTLQTTTTTTQNPHLFPCIAHSRGLEVSVQSQTVLVYASRDSPWCSSTQLSYMLNVATELKVSPRTQNTQLTVFCPYQHIRRIHTESCRI